jgi:hypothetical protein
METPYNERVTYKIWGIVKAVKSGKVFSNLGYTFHNVYTSSGLRLIYYACGEETRASSTVRTFYATETQFWYALRWSISEAAFVELIQFEPRSPIC